MGTINIETIIARLTDDEYSPYGIYKIMNELFGEGTIKRPQYMYNYAANGMIVKGVKIAKASLRKITKQEVATWIVRYANKNDLVLKGTEVNPDQLELDLEI